MPDVRSQDSLNRETLEVSSRSVPFPDDIAMHIRRVRKLAPLLFSAIAGSIFVEN